MIPSSASLLPIGATFHGRYQISRRIGKGGMGEVYEVRDLSTRKSRALKVMRPDLLTDSGLRARFEQEARITADIDSEHIVEITDAGTDPDTGFPFITMELLKGDDLSTMVRKRGGLPATEVVTLLDQAADALDKTHQAGIVHRDLKPENLFVTRRSDGSPRLKVLDFGIAKIMATSFASAKTTCVIGTPLYMAPEQFRGDGTVDSRADTYALGHIAFSLLVGMPYWTPESSSANALMKAVERGLPEPACARALALRGVRLPPAFDPWFAKATGVAPAIRFDTACELVDELAEALGVRESRHTRRQGPLPQGYVFRKRYRIVRHIGNGGMAEVYEVVDQITGRHRALKLMQSKSLHDIDLRRRFLVEAKVTAGVESRHLVEVVDAAEDVETEEPFLVMELLKGETLETILSRGGPLSAPDVLVLLRQAAEALDKTHAASIIHRDLKPGNLFLARTDDGAHVLKVIDFGLAKVVADGQTAVTRTLGTPVYMAPEQLGGGGKVDRRVDVYALGHITFALLVGAPYWSPDMGIDANIYQLMYQINRGAIEPATARAARLRNILLPPAMDEWFSRATAVDPSHRFSSASDLVAALAQVLSTGFDRNSRPNVPEHSPMQAPTPATVGIASTLPAFQQAARPAAPDFPTAPLSSSEMITLKQPAHAPALPEREEPPAPTPDPHGVATTVKVGSSPPVPREGAAGERPARTAGGYRRYVMAGAFVSVAGGISLVTWWITSSTTPPSMSTPDIHLETPSIPPLATRDSPPVPSSFSSALLTPSGSADPKAEPSSAPSIPPPVRLSATPTSTARPARPPVPPAAGTGPTGTKVR